MTADSTTQPDLQAERSPQPGEMTILEHLRELRRRVIISVLFLVAGVAISLYFWQDILGWMLAPARADPNINPPDGQEFRLSSFSPLDRIMVAFKIGMYGGIILATPVFVYHMLAFIHPALKANEKRTLYAGLIPIVFFLLGGLSFAYFIALPASLGFLLNFGGSEIDTVTGVRQYTDFVIRLVFWLGISFELPVIMALAARLGLVRARQYLTFWRYSLVLVAILAAIITPTPDAITWSYVFVPLLGLYFLGIGMSWIVEPRRRRSTAPASPNPAASGD